MWRPFANNFTLNTYGNFAKRNSKTPTFERRKQEENSDLFPYNTPQQDIESRETRFQALQAKVEKQREMIKLNDKLALKRLQNEKAKERKQLIEALLKRKEFDNKVRTYVENRVRSETPYIKTDKENDTSIFSLTKTNNTFKEKKRRIISERARSQEEKDTKEERRIEIKVYEERKEKKVREKPVISLRTYEDLLLERAPVSCREIMAEGFKEIREEKEMTMQDYRKKRTNNYNPVFPSIQMKSRNLSVHF